jgi:cytochrome b
MKTYIWAFPIRLFHWLLAISFTIVYILGDFDEFRNFHFAFGAFTGALIFFRLLYGLFGPKYSHFLDFPIGWNNQIEFIKTFFTKAKAYPGHNPAASIVMLCIFIVGLSCSISGYFLYTKENNILILSFDKDFLKDTHEIIANIFLGLVIFHLIGVVSDLIFHAKNGTLQSIFSGYKNIESENVKTNNAQKLFSVLWFVIPFIFFYFAYGLQINNGKQENDKPKLEKNERHEKDEEQEDEEQVNED